MMIKFNMRHSANIIAQKKTISKLSLWFFIALIIHLCAINTLWADTLSNPVSVAIPTGIEGQLSSKPVSIAIPTGLEGEILSQPVSIAIPVGLDGEILSQPLSIEIQPANIGDGDLIGLWHMDGDVGDSSGNGNHAQCMNGVTFSDIKKVGSQSGSFDGSNDYAIIRTPNNLFHATNFTVCGWIYPREAKSSGLINYSTESDGVWELWYDADGSIKYRHNWSRSVDIEEFKTVPGSAPLNEWLFVSLVYTDHYATLYLNGQVAASTSFENNPLELTDSYLEFGCNHAGSDEYYNGLIDEAAIYQRALTAEELEGIYNRIILESTPPPQPVVEESPTLVNTETLTLSGTKETATSLWVKGIKQVNFGDETSWQLDVALEPGPNLISITTRNEYGIESDPVIVTVIRDDNAPTLSSSTPTDGAPTNQVDQVTLTLEDQYAEIDQSATIVNATLINNLGEIISGTWSPSGTSAVVFTPQDALPDGQYIATIHPTDSLGNQTLINVSFTLDTVPPEPPTFAPVGAVGDTITLKGNKSVATTTVVFNATSGTLSTPTYPSTSRWQASASNLSQGETTFSVYALDKAGNKSETTTLTLEVDITPPAQPTVEPFTTLVATESITLSGTKEVDAHFYVNNVEYDELLTADSWTLELPLDGGENTFSLVTGDDAGNLCEPVRITVIRDNSAPIISASSPKSDAVISALDEISVTLSDQYSSVDYASSMATAMVKDNTGSLINGTWSQTDDTLHFVPENELAQGLYRVQLTAVDTFSNSGTVLFSFTLDDTTPSVSSVTMTPPSPHKAETVVFQFNFNEKMDTSVHPLVSLSKLRVLFDNSYFIVGNSTAIPTVNDDFNGDNGTQPNQDRWQVLNSENSRIQLKDESLNITVTESSDTEWPRLVGKWKLAGDFDIRVDYSVNTLGSVSGNGIGLQLNFDDGYFVRVARGLYAGDQFRGLIQKAGAVLADSQISTADTTGVLRLTRSGSLIQCWYASSAEGPFNEICQATASEADATIELAGRCGQTDSPSSIDVSLDNFSLESGTVNGLGNSGNTGYWIDNDTWQGRFTFTEDTGDGNYEVIIAGAQDMAGNTMSEQVPETFTLDTIAPEPPSIFDVSNPTQLATQILHGSKPSGTAIVINGVTKFPLGQITTWEVNYPLTEGENKLTVSAADEADNLSLPVTSSITLDTTPPTFSIDSYQTQSANASQTLSGRKEAGCTVALNGELIISADNMETTWSHQVTLAAGVVSRYVFVATDNIGNSTTRSIDLIYDEDAPASLGSGMLQADGNGRGTEVLLTWPAYVEAQDIAYYRVYYSTSDFSTISGLTAIGTAERANKSFTVSGLTEGTPYYFAVEPVDTSGNSEQTVSTTIATPVDNAAPEDVSALKATADYNSATGNSITLTWTASNDSRGDLSEHVLYIDSGSGYDNGTPLDKTLTSHTVTALNDATRYKFKLTVRDDSGHESSGSTTEAMTRLENPTNLTLIPGKNQISLSWQAGDATNVNYYKIYRLQSSQTQTDVASMSAIAAQDQTSYIDTGLLNGVTYQYAVTTVNTSGAENTSCESISASPRQDAVGPVINGFNITDGQVITAPITIEISASDAESALQKIELYIDDTLVASNGSSTLNYFWNVVEATDGNHSLKVVATDSLDNKTEETRTAIVSLAVPSTPAITAHSTVTTSPTTVIAINGTSPLFTTVTVKANGVVVGQTATTTNGTFSLSGVSLVEGQNLLSVKASHRGGDSPYSANYTVLVDTGAPPAPTTLAASAQAGGTIQLTWQNGSGETPSGYNIYTSGQSFTSAGQSGVNKLNTSPVTYLFYQTVPDTDENHFYAITSVDAAGNESPLSNVIEIAADHTAPQVIELNFSKDEQVVTSSTATGPGNYFIKLTVSEPLVENPFLSLEPQVGSPIILSLTAIDDTTYTATMQIDATSPNGPLTWKFSGKDLIGNRGNEQGAGPLLDVRGPIATIAQPVQIAQLHTTVDVAIEFNENVVGTPSLAFTDSDGTTVPVPVTALQQGEDSQHWQGLLDLTSMVEGNGTFSLIEARDGFNNIGTTVAVGETLILYEDMPPAPETPEGLTAETLPGGEILLEWQAVTGAAGYRIYRQTGDGSDAVAIADSSQTTYTDLPSSDGTYHYFITAIGLLESESGHSVSIAAQSDRVAPESPVDLELSLDGSGVKANWNVVEGSETAASYRLYRNAQSITTITGLTAVSKVEALEGIDTSPITTKRHYAVTAVDAAGNESTPSTSVEIEFPVSPVADLVLIHIEGSSPQLTWKNADASNDIVGYWIYRNNQKVLSTPTPGTIYIDSYYTEGTVTYGIAAIDQYGNESPIRQVTLPDLSLSVPDETSLRRGLLETITVDMTANSDAVVKNLQLKVGSAVASTLNGPFTLTPQTPLSVNKVVATALDAPETVAIVGTAELESDPGTTVRLTRTLSIPVAASGSAFEIFNDPLVRGTYASVRLQLNNLGSARMEVITSRNNRASDDVVVYLKDQDGNILAQGKLNQRTGSKVVTSSNYATARIEPGDSFLTDPITFKVPESAPYAVVLEAVIGNTYYHYNLDDQVTAPGMKQRQDATINEVSYSATAQAEHTLYTPGKTVLITGQAVSNTTGEMMGNVPVNLGISVKGYDRTISVTTDPDGTFSYRYDPAGVTGTFNIWASHPDIEGRSIQDRFDVIGLSLNQSLISLKLTKGSYYDIPLRLSNLSQTALTDLSIDTTTSTGITASFLGGENDSRDLAAEETRSLKLRVGSSETSPDTGYVTVVISTDEGLSVKCIVNVALASSSPVISTSPSYIDAGLVRGTQKIETFTIKNRGLGNLLNAYLEEPSTSWMKLAVNPEIGSLAVGQKTDVGILLTPDSSVVPGIYNDRIIIRSDNHIAYTYNIQVTVTSDAVGNVQFDVLNELYEDVAGATITLQHQNLAELYYTLKTKSDGTVSIFDIPEGRYSYMVNATGHKSYSNSLVVQPGLTISVPIALEVTLVEVEWSVTEITIEDRYEIKVEQTFETNVPTSVIVVDPAAVVLPELAPGDVYNGEIRITNHGLISAEFVGLNFPQTIGEDMDLEVLNAIPDHLQAEQTIVIPYRITRREQQSDE